MHDTDKLILNLYGAAQECRPGEFHEHALALIKSAMPFDSGAVIRATFPPGRDLQVLSMHNHRQPVEKLLARRELSGPDPTLMRAYSQQGRCITENLMELDQRAHGEIIEYARRFGVAQSLVLIQPTAQAEHFDVIALWRSLPRQVYSAAEEHAAGRLLPHLMRARSINEQLHQRGPYAAGALTLVASREGCLQFAPAPAIAMLQAEWRDWKPPVLPPPLMHALASGSALRYQGRHLTAQASVSERYLHLTLEPQTVGATLLSPAELACARLAAAGASYKEIARELDRSPSTVRNQLHHAYAKLGVSNKTALAQALGAAPSMT